MKIDDGFREQWLTTLDEKTLRMFFSALLNYPESWIMELTGQKRNDAEGLRFFLSDDWVEISYFQELKEYNIRSKVKPEIFINLRPGGFTISYRPNWDNPHNNSYFSGSSWFDSKEGRWINEGPL